MSPKTPRPSWPVPGWLTLLLLLLLAGGTGGGGGCASSTSDGQGASHDTGPGRDTGPGGSDDGPGPGPDTGTDAVAADTGPDAGDCPGSSDAGVDTGLPQLRDLVRYVDPRIGTDDSSSPRPVPGGAGGSTYPGAVVPFGMVQLGPDTPTASPSGYRCSDTEIEQFSLTHFDGAGCPNNEDLPFLPVVGAVLPSPGTSWSSFRTGYAKASEAASPGYYRVDLERNAIRVELTATPRTGMARFTYPPSALARVLLQAGLSATGRRSGSLEIVDRDRLRGTVTAGGFCGSATSFPIHFVVAFDHPFTAIGTLSGSTVTAGAASVEGTSVGGFVTFDTTGDPTVQMKIGLSYVSIANAELNLEAENPGWDFEAIRRRAASNWNDVLGRIEVTGGSDEELTKFYTALYHVFQSPSVASDVNGDYAGFDGHPHTNADRVTYQNYSGWDIIRSWTHLVSAIAPEAPAIIGSLVQDGVEGGLLPFWTHENVETHVMVGDPGTVNVANAFAMGVRGFDTAAALRLMQQSADDPLLTQRWALDSWIRRHYTGNTAVDLEYALADFALARFAESLGDTAAHDRYLARSAYWREGWYPADGYLEPRGAGGAGAGADAARIYEFQVFGPAAPDTNLALGRAATASASCNASEGPDKAVNGTWNGGSSDKWCDNSSQHKWWRVDLGSVQQVSRFTLYHAGAGGESAAWNTQDFSIEVSQDGADWTTVATVVGNTDDVSTHVVAAGAVTARHVRLVITTAIQTAAPGAWACQPFDPASDCGYVEGNGAQYVWLVPHDLEGLLTLMGGHAAAVARLDDLFTELNAGTARPYFYIGNEPEHGTPWTYNFAGKPARTQEVVRRIVDQEFNTSPGGLPGNDDLGATSAWLVWAYLGMYPVVPGTDVLVLHGPSFPAITVHLASGRKLTIAATGAGPQAPYVQGLRIDGTPTTRSWLRFADLAGGATLDYSMGPAPSADWGTGPADLPPSFSP